MERAVLIGIDTNILLRVFIQQDSEQALLVRELIGSRTAFDPAWVSLVVLCEFAWVLSKTFKVPRAEIVGALSAVLNTAAFRVEREAVAMNALHRYMASRADFGDCCIAALAETAGCSYTATFDKDAAKLPGMRLLA